MKKECFKGCFCSNEGFTLIELLVVVLIIGILAAVAVPQYKLAIVKTKVATILPILTNAAEAEETYYLANGTYTIDARKLDFTMPSSCKLLISSGQQWKCGKEFLIDFTVDAYQTINASYCPGYNNADSSVCISKRDFLIRFRLAHRETDANTRSCASSNNSSLGKKVCKSISLR